MYVFFFFQAEDGIRDGTVTGVQTCALPICWSEVPGGFALSVQATDILWPCLISVFTNGAETPFYLFFIFAMLAAAFRWGMREALFAMVVAVATLAGEGLALNHSPNGAPNHALNHALN